MVVTLLPVPLPTVRNQFLLQFIAVPLQLELALPITEIVWMYLGLLKRISIHNYAAPFEAYSGSSVVSSACALKKVFGPCNELPPGPAE